MLLIHCTSRHLKGVLVCPCMKCMYGSLYDVNESNVTLSLMLKKHVKVMSYMMKQWMIIVVWLSMGILKEHYVGLVVWYAILTLHLVYLASPIGGGHLCKFFNAWMFLKCLWYWLVILWTKWSMLILSSFKDLFVRYWGDCIATSLCLT